MKDIFHLEDGTEEPENPYAFTEKAMVHQKYTLSNRLWQYLQTYAAKHRAKGNGFGYRLVSRTLSAHYYKDGSEILASQGDATIPHKLTLRECARLMGFPDTYKIAVSDTQAYKQFGNAVVVPVIQAVANIVRPRIILNEKVENEKRLSLAVF